VLINNAGVGYAGRIVDSDPDETHRILEGNLLGVYHTARRALPAMLQRGEGHVVFPRSVGGRERF